MPQVDPSATSPSPNNTTSRPGDGRTCGRPPDGSVPIAGDATVCLQGGHLTTNTQGTPVEKYPYRLVVNATCEDLSHTLLVDGTTLPSVFNRCCGLIEVRVDLRPGEPGADLPPNHDLLVPAARQVAAVVREEPEAAPLQVDADQLDKDLDRLEYLHALKIEADAFAETVHNAWSRAMRKTGDQLKSAVDRADQRLSGRMQQRLALAYKMIKEPGQRAIETRRNNQQVAQRATAEERARHQPAPSATPVVTDPTKKP